MVDYFQLPKRVAEGRRQVLVTSSYLEEENPFRYSTLAAFSFLPLVLLAVLKRRSGRMLCATSPGECVGSPELKLGVCLVRMSICLDF